MDHPTGPGDDDGGPRTGRDATDGESASRDGEPPTEAEVESSWDAADDDPDLEDDLGYDPMPLDVLVTSNSDKKVMVIPRAEEWIRDDAYIIADFDLAVDPIERT